MTGERKGNNLIFEIAKALSLSWNYNKNISQSFKIAKNSEWNLDWDQDYILTLKGLEKKSDNSIADTYLHNCLFLNIVTGSLDIIRNAK